jgi:hypothetical protein
MCCSGPEPWNTSPGMVATPRAASTMPATCTGSSRREGTCHGVCKWLRGASPFTPPPVWQTHRDLLTYISKLGCARSLASSSVAIPLRTATGSSGGSGTRGRGTSTTAGSVAAAWLPAGPANVAPSCLASRMSRVGPSWLWPASNSRGLLGLPRRKRPRRAPAEDAPRNGPASQSSCLWTPAPPKALGKSKKLRQHPTKVEGTSTDYAPLPLPPQPTDTHTSRITTPDNHVKQRPSTTHARWQTGRHEACCAFPTQRKLPFPAEVAELVQELGAG